MPGARATSVVIPTYNRRESLARVLDGLDRQTADPADFEVIVVDDGSTDGTSEWLREQRHVYELRSIHQANAGPARARNTGVEAAFGELLVFLDDDVLPSPELIEQHRRSHGIQTDLAVIGPLGSLPSYRQPWVAWEQAKLERQYSAMTRGDWEPTFRQFWTGNASIRREHVLAVGGFDSAFLRAEDVELAYRLHQRGIKFRFNPAARVTHHAERSLDSWVNAQRSYGRLEVSIFGKFSEETLIKVLAENWSRMHPASRLLVQGCMGRPLRHGCVTFLLRSWLQIEAATRPIAAEKVCSAFASLLYWQASTEALGPDRTHDVFRRGEEIRSTRGAS